MKKTLAVLGAVLLVLGLTGCGGGGSSSSPTSSSGSALLMVSQTSVGQVDVSSNPAYTVELRLPVSFSNGREVACNLNYVRLQIFDLADVELERAEVSSEDIIALAGTNRVVQGAPVQVTLVFGFNTLQIPRVSLTANALDDHGNEMNRSLASLEVEATPELIEFLEGLAAGQ